MNWIVVTIIAAFFQNLRSSFQKKINKDVSTIASTYVRFSFALPLALVLFFIYFRDINVIYDVIDDAKQIMGGMLSPEIREEIVGIAEVRDVFNSPKFGQIAGSMVIEGTVYRSKPIRVLREDVVIYEGELESLRRFKDDATEVRNGMECGIGVRNYTDVKIGDKIEVYETTEIARSL